MDQRSPRGDGLLGYTGPVSKEMERDNSFGTAEEPHPKVGGFFASGHCTPAPLQVLIFGREGDGYNTRKGKKSAWLYPGF